jgi:hypothetical protein
MSDYPSSLPVRTEADADERLQSKIIDFTSPANGMTVDADGNAHTEVHGNRADDSADVALTLSETGRVNPDGVYEADDNSKPAHVGVVAHTRAETPADAQLTNRITSVTNDTVHALDVAIHDASGAPFSASNPLPVQPLPLSGTRVHNYKGGEIVKAATDNHDITVAGTALNVYKILFAASGRGRYVVQVDPDGVSGFSTIAVGYTSTSKQIDEIDFNGVPLQIAVGGIVRVARTNQDKADMDMHSTIVGIQ